MYPEGFRTAELHLHRPVVLQRRQSCQVLRRNVFLAAEASADELVLHNYAFLAVFPAEHDSHLVSGVISSLVCRQYLDTVLIREGHGALRFKEGVLRERRCERSCRSICRLFESLCRIAPYNVPLLAEVPVPVDLRSSFSSCLGYVLNRLKYFVFYLYRLLGLLKYVWRFSNHDAYGISHHSGRIALCYHNVPVLLYMAHFVVRHISCCQDSDNARQ